MSSFAGKFLVAKTNLQDASFRQSVVLLLQHGDAGAFGLVVNRAVTVEGLPFPVFAGGPCESSSEARQATDPASQVDPRETFAADGLLHPTTLPPRTTHCQQYR